MLELKNITKTYKTGDLTQVALDDVSIAFRDCEFVSVLGPSGSGKTTLLNIVGGLDRYDSGDLIIDGRSTTSYRDRDWDTYRNHTIGFVFQSYNLIPHQSVLSNVELAMTIGGVSRRERTKRAMDALAQVGLAEQAHKLPSQLSGGQAQRVAIARALVNDPAIVLADEPTGALDTDTGVQVMEILKEVSRNRLVIMVTHNPELAEAYSTRIVRLRDGRVTADSDPFEPETEGASAKASERKTGMSFLTALSLSFQNLRTKIGRTLLTAFAGSIGIIGIALILSLSEGVTGYIDSLQRDTMTSYPITIESQAVDVESMMQIGPSSFGPQMGSTAEYPETPSVVSASFDDEGSSPQFAVVENDLTAFKTWLDDPSSEVASYIGENGVVYAYDMSFSVYTREAGGTLVDTSAEPDSGSELPSDASTNQMEMMQARGPDEMDSFLSGSTTSGSDNLSEYVCNADGSASRLVTDSYELLYGAWPASADELVLVLDEDGSLPAKTLCQLGLITADDYLEALDAIDNGDEAPELSWTFEEACSQNYYLVLPCTRYEEQEDGTFAAVELDDDALVDAAVELHISGVVRPVEDAANTTIDTPLAHGNALTAQLIERTDASAVVAAQEADPETDVLTGEAFEDEDGSYEENLAAFGKVSYDAPSSISIYVDSFEDKEAVAACIERYNESLPASDQITYTDYVALMTSTVSSMVNVVSYVLVAFVAVSLVVSCIMVGIITHISVLERTKEIGILRALGASKANVSQVFLAETVIVGLVSGLLGVSISAALCIPVRSLLESLMGVALDVTLPVVTAGILVALSTLITMLGGIIPARGAARKDPVEALRTE